MRTAIAGLYICNGGIDLISTVGGHAVQLTMIGIYYIRGGLLEWPLIILIIGVFIYDMVIGKGC